MSRVRDGDEVANLLRRALEIEKTFESAGQWEGYLNLMGEQFREVLFQLITESDTHGRLVESMIQMVKVTPDHVQIPLQTRRFDFKQKNDLEIMMDIGKTEKMMLDLYTSVRDSLEGADPEDYLNDPADNQRFADILDRLIGEETNHAKIISRYAGHVERIR
jgi:rubrerythrin